MIQSSFQNITAILLCRDKEKAQEILKQFSSPKLCQGRKTVNIFYEPIDFNIDEDVYKYLSLFEHAIFILHELEFQNLELTNTVYKLLKLLYQFKYKQIILVPSFEEKQINSSQYKAFCQWVQDECSGIMINNRIENEKSLLNFPLPQMQTQTNLDLQSILEFFNCEQDLINSDLNIAIINQKKQKNTYLAYVLSGYALNGQIIQYPHEDNFEKAKILKLVDFFKQEPVNFISQGDIVEIEIEIKNQSPNFLFGLSQTKYQLPNNKDIRFQIHFTQPQRKGYSHKLQKARLRCFIFGQEFEFQNKPVKESYKNPTDNQNEHDNKFLLHPIGITLKPLKQTYQPFILKDKPFLFFNTLNKTVDFKIPYYGVLEVDLPLNVIKPQTNFQKAVVIRKVKTPAFENMMKDGVDYRQKCRVCRTENVRYVPNVCGHLRYCVDCKELCIEAKSCLYCDKAIQKMIGFNIFLTERDTNELQSMEKKEIIEYFSEVKGLDLKPGLLVDLEINTEEINKYSFACDNCPLHITHYAYCKTDHVALLCKNCNVDKCKKCDEEMIKQEIIYTFHDDPTS